MPIQRASTGRCWGVRSSSIVCFLGQICAFNSSTVGWYIYKAILKFWHDPRICRVYTCASDVKDENRKCLCNVGRRNISWYNNFLILQKINMRATYHRSINTDCDILKDLCSQKRCKEGIESNHQKEENRNCNDLSEWDDESGIELSKIKELVWRYLNSQYELRSTRVCIRETWHLPHMDVILNLLEKLKISIHVYAT